MHELFHSDPRMMEPARMPPLHNRQVSVSLRGFLDYLTGRLGLARHLNDLCLEALMPRLTGEVIELGATQKANHRKYANQATGYVLSNISGEKGSLYLDAMDMDLPAESVENIVAAQVFEHIPRPWKAVDEIHRVLKPNGKLLIVTPFLFPFHAAPGDYYRYTNEGLAALLKNFRILHIESLGNIFTTCAVFLQHPYGSTWRPWRPIERLLIAMSRVAGAAFYLLSSSANSASDYATLYAVLAEKSVDTRGAHVTNDDSRVSLPSTT